MGSNISSDTLFHFMNKFDYLEETLKGNFSPRYVEEKLNPFFKESVYIAMKCFCDIPLSMVQNHSKVYGPYGIGFSKEWGERIGLNPITYYNEKSKFVNDIRVVFNSNVGIMNSTERTGETLEKSGAINKAMKNMFLNFKPTKGIMNRDGKEVEKHFYDEREWRYISTYNRGLKETADGDYHEIRPYYTDEDLTIMNYTLSKCNRELSKELKIPFSISDIKFIIVKEDFEIDKICNLIDGKNINISLKNRLKTKIIKSSDIKDNV